jgi:Ion channel
MRRRRCCGHGASREIRVTTLATVGFGDVHAQGPLARLVATIQTVPNLVVLASAARVLIRGISQRSQCAVGPGAAQRVSSRYTASPQITATSSATISSDHSG